MQGLVVNSSFISLILVFILVTLDSAQADTSDWVQVERFNKQMEQAKDGKVSAMFEVGRMYERGRGTNRSMSSAAQWYKKAADAKYAPAQSRLGIMYVEGRGVNKNLDKALTLLTSAANENVPSAQYQLATMYELGVGTARNPAKAIRWYKKAAAGGYYQAKNKVRELELLSPGSREVASAPLKRSAGQLHPTAAALLKGSWARSNRPAGYLPSSISNCQSDRADELKCISTAQERNTGTEIISFNTEATISNFTAKKFTVRYVNNVLEVETIEADVYGLEEDAPDDDEEASKSRIKTGKQAKVHVLQCTLSNARTVKCSKGAVRTFVFNRTAG